jgi:CBS domain-containing protein
MRQANLGCAVLVDEDQKPKGIFVERRLTQLLATNPQAMDDPVEKHVDSSWPQVSLSDPIAKVLAALMEHNTRFIPVVDDGGRVVKLTGQKGLMEFIADHYPNQVAVHRLGQKPYMQEREGA